jgi:peptidoglycan/LPS O-acetylase OafA/YrhL
VVDRYKSEARIDRYAADKSTDTMRSGSAPPFQSTVASVLLDALRGVAALLVCIDHWRYLLFIDYPQLTFHRTLFFLPYAMCTMGHQAVIVFFVLSGYLVGGHVLRARDTGRWSWSAYLIQRGVRLWTVLIPALVLGGLIDLVALHLRLAPALYSGMVHNHVTGDVHLSLTWKALLGNIFFLQTIRTPVFGSNGALWSLASEFWYYLLFPLGLLAIRGPYSVGRRVAMAAGFVGISFFVGRGIMLLLPVWLLGVLLAVVPVRPTSAALRWVALAFYCFFFIDVMRLIPSHALLSDYALGVVTFAFLWILLGAQGRSEGRWYVQPSRTIAGFSYTLYLVHVPMLIFLTALLAGESRWQPDAKHLAIGFPLLPLVIGYAYVVAKCTEFRTAAVRDWAMRVFMKRGKVVAKTVA